MAIKYKTTKSEFPAIEQRLKALNGRKVIVGASGDHAWLVGIHEYGLKIAVTPEMRAYLHAKGLHLKASTTHIVIPERSFMRAGHDAHVDEVMKKVRLAVGQVVSGQMSEDRFLDMIGQMLSSKIKAYAIDLRKPENHPFTVEEKGTDNPLVGRESSMIESITWEVE